VCGRSVRVVFFNICKGLQPLLKADSACMCVLGIICFGGFETFGLQIRRQSTLAECFNNRFVFLGTS
jgi:hypothetical protein